MLHTEGDLFVRAITARRGRFHIGRLVTPCGDFSVKDPLIDQLDQGVYRGRFGIDHIFLVNTQLPSGALIVEMRARLALMHLETEAALSGDPAIGVEETDPADEPHPPAPAARVPEARPEVLPDPALPALTATAPAGGIRDTTDDTADSDPDPVAGRPDVDARTDPGSASDAGSDHGSDVTRPPGDAGPTDAADPAEAALFEGVWPLGPEVQLDPSVDRRLMRRQIEALKARGYRYAVRDQVWRLPDAVPAA